MGRQDSDLLVAHSSIALLQERFKQLEKMKEMREQRELLRLFPESAERRSGSAMHYNKPSKGRYCNPELSLSPAPSLHGSSLPFRQEKQRDYEDVKSLLSMNLWPTNANRANSRTSHHGYDNNEVDTSLHL
ncbi:hypothetical protein ACHQM5_025544 [Ranunculus cassubicifolius]